MPNMKAEEEAWPRPLVSLVRVLFLFATVVHMGATSMASAADLEPRERHAFGDWEAFLFENKDSGRLLCAAETQANGTTYRINHYKDSGDTFIEFMNAQWDLLEGDARFELEFSGSEGVVGLELHGKSWGNAYTHDILEKKNLNVILGLMTLQSRIKLLNSNRAPVGEFSLKGAKEALSRFVGCMNPSNADMQIEHGRSFLTIGFRPAGATNLDDCAAVCRSESRCNAFQFHRNPVHDPRVRKNVQCLLFDDKSGLISVPSPEITIGTKLKLASALA